MNSKFDLICLFGYSPFFSELSNLCNKINTQCALIFGSRQQEAIETLRIPEATLKIKTDSLECQTYKKLAISTKNCLGISFGAPFIFKENTINEFNGNLINSHGAPLPDFKGGGGFTWRILQRDKRGASLMHFISPEIDAGDCIFRHNFLFSDKERLPKDYELRQAKEDNDNLMPWLISIIKNEEMLKPIKDSPSSIHTGSYFPRISTDLHGYIDWKMQAHAIESFIHAFSRPYPGASTFLKGAKLRLFDCHIHALCEMHPFTWGLITASSHEWIHIAVNGGVIKIDTRDIYFESEAKKLLAGDRLITPEKYIISAMSSRAYFKPNGVFVKDFDVASNSAKYN